MARTLPWKKTDDAATALATATRRATPSASAVGGRAATPSRSVPVPKSPTQSTEASTKSTATSRPRKRARSVSTSLLPEPVPESFMIEGVLNDDQWRMVEDEFIAVAGTYTAHLHAAEYQRLKQLTRSQNADTIRNISRPVVGDPTDVVNRRLDVLAKVGKQRDALKRSRFLIKTEEYDAEDDDMGDDEVPWVGTSLQGLMDSPSKQALPLSSIISNRAVMSSQGTSSKRRGPISTVKNGDSQSNRSHIGRDASSNIKMTKTGADEPSNAADETDEGDSDDLDKSHMPQADLPRAPSRLPSSTSSSSVRSKQIMPIEPAGQDYRSSSALNSSSTPKTKSTPARQSPDSDSDGPVDTHFQRRMRERNSQREMSRHRSYG